MIVVTRPRSNASYRWVVEQNAKNLRLCQERIDERLRVRTTIGSITEVRWEGFAVEAAGSQIYVQTLLMCLVCKRRWRPAGSPDGPALFQADIPYANCNVRMLSRKNCTCAQ